MKLSTYPARLRCDPLFTHRRSIAYCITTADCSSYYKYTRWCWMRIARASIDTHARLWWILLLSLLLQLHGSNMKLNMTLSLTWWRRNADGPTVVRSFNERSERRGGDEENILVCFVGFLPIFFCMFYSSFSPSSPTNTRRALAKSGSNETAPSPCLPALQGTPKDVREDVPYF